MKKDQRNQDDRSFMATAVELAAAGARGNEGGPFGSVIVKNGVVIAKGYNKVISTKDPTAHAEIVAIRAAAEQVGDFHLLGCTLYTTCEPCPMCLAAAYWARIERIVYALTRSDAAALGFSDAEIYNEVSKPPGQRSIKMHRSDREQAAGLLDMWFNKQERILY